jgi:ADP-heptose:LPS heptosyltransferase
MHFRISDEEKSWAKNLLASSTDKKSVLVAPVSAMQGKNMEPRQIMPVVEELQNRGYYVFGIHNLPLLEYSFPYLCGTNIRQFISIINEVDYVISVDTSAFHCAGGLGKKMVAIFGWADGKVYSKYYPNTVLVQKHRDYTPGWTCGPCYVYSKCCKEPNDSVLRKPCITEITPEMILDGFDKLVEGK